MEALAHWRQKVPVATFLAGIVSLVVGASMYLVYGRLERPVLALLALGAALLVVYVVSDLENVAKALGGRQARYGGNTGAMILIFVAIVAVLNFLSARHSYRIDLTESREFSLSTQTVKVLESLPEPVQIKAFFGPNDFGGDKTKDLLKEYRRHSDKVEYEFVDYQARPGEAMRYQLETAPVIVMESAGRRQDVNGFSEQELTSAIFKLSRGEAKKVYFTAGHGEPDVVSMTEAGIGLVGQGLEASNYQVESVNLLATPALGEDVGALVVYAPKSALHEQERQAIKEYLDRGGKVMVVVSPHGGADLSDLLAPYGLAVGQGIAIDAAQSLTSQPFVPAITSYPHPSPITGEFQRSNVAVLMPMATQIEVANEVPAGVEIARLLETTDRSWLATDEQDINYREGDVRGPLTLAVAATTEAKAGGEEAEKAKTRLVVFGSADVASNILVDAWPVNRTLFVNAVNWLTEEEELISIRPQPPADRTLMLTGVQANLVLYSSVIFLPLAVLVVGGLVWWNRR